MEFLNRLSGTQLRLLMAQGHAEVIPKQPAEMPPATTAQLRELIVRVIDQFAGWHLVDEFKESLPGRWLIAELGPCLLHLLFKSVRNDLQHMATMR